MCFERGLNNKISNKHERALRVVYQNKKFSFETLLKHEKSCVSSYEKPRTYLAAVVVQIKNGHSPEITKDIFVFQENKTCNLRSGNHLARRNI